MNIDINSYDPEGSRPSLLLVYNADDQMHYVHKEFHGRYGTMVRITLLALSDRMMTANLHLAQMLLELQRSGSGTHTGGVRIRHNPFAHTLLTAMGELVGDNYPTPQCPGLPE